MTTLPTLARSLVGVVMATLAPAYRFPFGAVAMPFRLTPLAGLDAFDLLVGRFMRGPDGVVGGPRDGGGAGEWAKMGSKIAATLN